MKRIEKKEYIFLLLFVILSIILVADIKIGYWNDESFYLTIPMRLYQGESLFVDEWQGTQMFGFLLYPLFIIFRVFCKSNDSIILFFRYVYIFINIIAALFIYIRFRKMNIIGSMIISIFFLIYCPYLYRTTSYYALCIIFLTIACVLIITFRNNIELILCGIIFSWAVICNPYLVILFLIYSLYCLFINKNEFIKYKYILLGIFIMFIVFVLFVLSRASIKSIITSFGHMFNEKYNNPKSIILSFKSYLYYFVYLNKYNYIFCILYFFICLAILMFKKRNEYKNIIFLFSVIVAVVNTIVVIKYNEHVSITLYPLVILGFTSMIFGDKNNSLLYKYMFIPGIINSYCSYLSSDRMYMAICAGLIISCFSSCVMSSNILFSNIINKDNLIFISKKCFIILIIIQFVFSLNIRLTNFTSYISNTSKYEMINIGPGEGIIAPLDDYNEYLDYYDDIYQCNYSGNNILYLSKKHWLYLLKNNKYKVASYSTFPQYIGDDWTVTWDRLLDYYDLYPNKIPTTVYSEEKYNYFMNTIKDRYNIDYNLKRTKLGNYLYTIK